MISGHHYPENEPWNDDDRDTIFWFIFLIVIVIIVTLVSCTQLTDPLPSGFSHDLGDTVYFNEQKGTISTLIFNGTNGYMVQFPDTTFYISEFELNLLEDGKLYHN